MARGTTNGCDVPLTPRGRAAEGPRGAWVTRVHVSYIVYNIHIISLFIELANLSNPLPYLYASFPFIFSVWDYVPHGFLTLQVTWTSGERPISSWTASIAWTRVHAISKTTRG